MDKLMFLNRTDLDRFTNKHHRGVLPPLTAGKGAKVSKEDVATANLRLAAYGLTMSKELLDACFEVSAEEFHAFFDALYSLIDEETDAIIKADTVWPNYPHDVMRASDAAFYLANILNYISGGTWQPNFHINIICPALNMDVMQALKPIPMATENTAIQLAAEYISNNAPLSAETKCELERLMRDATFACAVADTLKHTVVPIKENAAYYMAWILPFVGESMIEQRCCQDMTAAKDVLRLAAACSNGDASLATNTKFRNFTRRERRLLLSLIENAQDIDESMASNREMWKRLGERLHPGEYKQMYPRTVQTFQKIRSGIHIETYNSKMEVLMRKPVNWKALTEHLMKRPGMFARYLDFCLRNCDTEDEMRQISFQFASVAKKVSPRVLLQLANHFRNRNNPVSVAVGKANGASAKVINAAMAPIPDEICTRVSRDICNELWQMLRAQEGANATLFIDPSCHLDKVVFPDNVRTMSQGKRVCACGSRFPMPADNVIRCFLYWKGKETSPYEGIDVDLSAAFLDSNFSAVETIAYFRGMCERIGAVHSGDRRSCGKKGAAEYIDFDVSAAKEAGIRYVVILANAYSDFLFSSIDTAFCGIMGRDGETGELFEPSTVTDKYDLTDDKKDLVPVMLDLYAREIIVIDRSVGMMSYSSIKDALETLITLARYATTLKSLSVQAMLQFRYSSITDDVTQADVVVTDNPDTWKGKKAGATVINPFDTQALLSAVFSD